MAAHPFIFGSNPKPYFFGSLPLITSGPSWEPETIAYMTAIAVPADGTLYYPSTIYERTGLQLWQAFDAFVVTGKSAGWWSKLLALYPNIGGTSASHKFNAINPVDTNAAFRLAFVGGVTHSAAGVTGNAVNGHSDTFFNDQTQGIDRNNFGYTFYSRSDVASSTQTDMGANREIPSPNRYTFIASKTASNTHAGQIYGIGGVSNYGAALTSLGSFTITRETAIQDTMLFYQNGVLKGTGSSVATAYINAKTYLMALNYQDILVFTRSSRNYAAHAIHNGLSGVEVTAFHTAIQTLQTALNRQV